jgi:hypothetical protein
MKFYIDKKIFYYWFKIINNNLTAVYVNKNKSIRFFKNGKFHNTKNAAYIAYRSYKEFILNDITFSFGFNFTKESWRKFVKLKVFL